MTLLSTDPYRYVIDKFYGAEYAINLITNECVIRPIAKYTPNPDAPFDAALDFISKFLDSGSFFPNNTQFIYHGDRTSNGINGQKFNAKVDSNIHEYTFSDSNTIFYNMDNEGENIPITLTIDHPTVIFLL